MTETLKKQTPIKTLPDSKIAVINTVSYNAQNKKLIIVPVENEFKPNKTDIENYLQNTYKSAVTFWDISLSDPLYVDFERNETKGLDTDLPGVAAYTKEMNKIKRALKKRQDYDPDAYYLFLIKKSEDGDKACPTTGGNSTVFVKTYALCSFKNFSLRFFI